MKMKSMTSLSLLSFLFWFTIFVSAALESSLPKRLMVKEHSPTTEEATIILQLLFTGPLNSSDVVIYFDDSVPEEKMRQILTRFSIDYVPASSIDLGQYNNWTQNEGFNRLGDPRWICLLFFENNLQSDALHGSMLEWSSENVLLFNLGNTSASRFLQNPCFASFHRVVAIVAISPGKKKFTLNTYYPFSRKYKVLHMDKDKPLLSLTFEDVFPERFKSFEGHKFRVGIWLDDMPFMYYVDQGTPKPKIIDGVSLEMLKAQAKFCNFTFALLENPPDGFYGTFVNNSWTGLLGMLQRNETDFAINAFAVTGDKIGYFDGTTTYWSEGFAFALLTPPLVPRWQVMWRPYTLNVWLAILTTLVLSTLLLMIQNSALPKPSDRFPSENNKAWLMMFQLLIENGWEKIPRAQHQRLFVASWILLCFILSLSYKTILVTFLTVPLSQRRIETLDELAKSKYRVALLDYGSHIPAFLSGSNFTTLRALSTKLDLISNYDDIVVKLLNKTHTIVDTESYIVPILQRFYKVRNFYLIKEQIAPRYRCWYFTKGFAFVHRFSEGMQRMVEAGLIKYWMDSKGDQILRGGNDTGGVGGFGEGRRQPESNSEPLNMEHMQGVFLILILMCALATMVFFVEILADKLKRRQIKNNNKIETRRGSSNFDQEKNPNNETHQGEKPIMIDSHEE